MFSLRAVRLDTVLQTLAPPLAQALSQVCVDLCSFSFSIDKLVLATGGGGCSAGTFMSGSTCSECAAGAYSSTVNSTSCYACAKGKYTATTGSSVCSNCGAGYIADADMSVACTPCNRGYYA